jgi:hypothetical protein
VIGCLDVLVVLFPPNNLRLQHLAQILPHRNTNLNNNTSISLAVTPSSFVAQNQSQPSAFGGTRAFGSNQPSAFSSSSRSAFSNEYPPKPSAPSKLKTGPPDF